MDLALLDLKVRRCRMMAPPRLDPLICPRACLRVCPHLILREALACLLDLHALTVLLVLDPQICPQKVLALTCLHLEVLPTCPPCLPVCPHLDLMVLQVDLTCPHQDLMALLVHMALQVLKVLHQILMGLHS